MGRKQATGVVDRKTGEVKREGLVKPEMMEGWLTARKRRAPAAAGLDESPDCYKRLAEVLAAHGETIRVLHTLTPLACDGRSQRVRSLQGLNSRNKKSLGKNGKGHGTSWPLLPKETFVRRIRRTSLLLLVNVGLFL